MLFRSGGGVGSILGQTIGKRLSGFYQSFFHNTKKADEAPVNNARAMITPSITGSTPGST